MNLKAIGASNTGGDFDALPEGRYQIEVEEAKLGKSREKQTPCIDVTFRVISGQYENRKLWNSFYLTEKSYFMLYNFLKAAGSALIDEEDVSEEVIANAMVGMRVSAWTQPGKTPSGNPKNDLSKWSAIKTDDDAGHSVSGGGAFDFK